MKDLLEVVGQRVVQFQAPEIRPLNSVESLRRRPAHLPVITWPICWEFLPDAERDLYRGASAAR